MSPADLDKKYLWHPFTQMQDWCAPSSEPIVIVEGQGAILRDDQGREYVDGNSSIWTNLHGHRHPKIDAALRDQLAKIAHTSFLGLTNEVAPRLAQMLVQLMERGRVGVADRPQQVDHAYRVFLSDDGSTAIEAGLKIILQAREQRGETQRKNFVSLSQSYHGDTVGAMSLGHSKFFHRPFSSVLFPTCEAPTPACYRCPHNRATPERGADARTTRKCDWECLDDLRTVLDQQPETTAAFLMEPLVQGAAGMLMHPPGYLKEAAKMCADRGIWLMLDEVMTAFGRTGTMFAFEKEKIQPDIIALAKGLTGGYLPLAATIATGEIFDDFLGEYREFKTFFHGHSYSGNPLGCAAAIASLELLADEQVQKNITNLSNRLREKTQIFWSHPKVGDVRQEGLICAIELVADFKTRQPFPMEERIGARVCEAARQHGLLTRPIGNVLVLMPPYCITESQLDQAVDALWKALGEVLNFKLNA